MLQRLLLSDVVDLGGRLQAVGQCRLSVATGNCPLAANGFPAAASTQRRQGAEAAVALTAETGAPGRPRVTDPVALGGRSAGGR
jgi:hypothetical protein